MSDHSATRPVAVSASVGPASAAPLLDDGLDAAELPHRVDTAMYAAQGQGQATWVVDDPDRHGRQPVMLQLT